MTTAELISRFRQLVAYDLDPIIGQNPTDGDIVTLLNEAMVEIATVAYMVDPAVSLTITPGIGTYALEGSAFARRIIEPFSVIADGRRLASALGYSYGCGLDSSPGLWTPSELNRSFPAWPSDAPGSVARAVWAGDRLILHPAPSTAITVTVEAQVLPLPLDAAAGTVEPELPVRLHPAIPQLAAFRACGINAQQNDQFTRLQSQVSEAMTLAAAIGKRNKDSRFGLPSTWAGSQPDYFTL